MSWRIAWVCSRSSLIADAPVPDTDWYVETMISSIPTARWIGLSATTIAIVEQFGLETIPLPPIA